MGRPAKTPEEIVKNLLDNVICNTENDCWECHLQPTMIRPGYYKHYIMVGGRNGKRIRATRLVYTVCKGEIPKGLNVLHECDNPLCINPAHLFLGTLKENTQDMMQKGRNKFISWGRVRNF